MKLSWRANQLRTREALRDHALEVWNQLSLRQDYTQNLINSMRRRLELVIQNKRYWIPYW